MNRLCSCLLFLSLITVSGLQAAEKRPNILLLLADDQRADTIAALGNPVIETPHLDQLVRRGTVVTWAHSPYPVCVPSRAEILTGATGFRNGMMPPYSARLKEDVALWPEVMRAAGYHTWYVGKWHTPGRPSTRGYEESLGLFSSGGGRYWKDRVDFKGIPVTGYRGWIFQTDDGKLMPEYGVGLTANISARFADAAIEFIRRKPEKPFFLHVNFTAPHDPLIMPPGYEDRYDPASIPLPSNFLPRHPFDHGNLRGRDERMLPWPRTPQAVRENLAMYYRVISHLDEQVGRILTALDETGQRDNTIVIYTSDHGLAAGSHGLMGKQNMYDHTVLVPLIFAGPGVPEGQRRDVLAYLRDLMPTACQMAGIEIPDSVEGRSLMPVIQGRQPKVYDRVFCYFHNVQRMVRDTEWKLIYYPKIERYQLFHTHVDPYELHDLAGDERYADKKQQLLGQLRSWQRQVGDPLLAPARSVE